MKTLVQVSLLVAVLVMSAAAAQSLPKGAHPIVNARDGWLIGGTVNGKWLDAEAMTPYVKGGETYRIYSLKAYLGKTTGSKVRVADPGPTSYIDLKNIPDVIFDAIGISATWDPMPRKAQVVS